MKLTHLTKLTLATAVSIAFSARLTSAETAEALRPLISITANQNSQKSSVIDSDETAMTNSSKTIGDKKKNK